MVQILALHLADERRLVYSSTQRGSLRVKSSLGSALVVGALVALAPRASFAAPPAPEPAAVDAAPKPPPAPPKPAGPPSSPRELPEYDGRPPPAATAGDGFLWVPRVVLFPLHVVSEYVLRRPLGALTVAAERGKWIETLTDVFTFGPTGNIGIVPTALLDFGVRTSVGVYAFYDDFLVKDNALRVHAAFGGTDWLRLTVADIMPIGKNATLKIRGEASRRPDFFFYGIGPTSRLVDRARYGSDWVDGSATFHATLPHGVGVNAFAGVRTTRFYDQPCCTYLSVRDIAADPRYPLPAAYDTGYTGFRTGGDVSFDTRRPRPEPGSGVRIEANGSFGTDLRAPEATSWVKYGGTVRGFVDVTGHNHVISLSATALFVDPLQDKEIPFVELVALGGVHPMAGFREGRLFGRSAAVATLEYRYPIWAFLDGAAQLALGNVFDKHLDGLTPENLRLSFDFGVRAAGDRDHAFSVLVGAGTETFGQGAHLNEARLLFGATTGF
jgi:surface antigen Omp85-like protein